MTNPNWWEKCGATRPVECINFQFGDVIGPLAPNLVAGSPDKKFSMPPCKHLMHRPSRRTIHHSPLDHGKTRGRLRLIKNQKSYAKNSHKTAHDSAEKNYELWHKNYSKNNKHQITYLNNNTISCWLACRINRIECFWIPPSTEQKYWFLYLSPKRFPKRLFVWRSIILFQNIFCFYINKLRKTRP